MANEQRQSHATPRGWADGRVFSDNRGCLCPACKSDAVTYTGDYTSDTYHLRRQAACNTCGEQWQALWRMIGYDPAPIARVAAPAEVAATAVRSEEAASADPSNG